MGPSTSNGRRRLLVLAALSLAGAAVDTVAAQQGPPTGPGPSYFDPKSFNPSMAIVMVVLVTAFFLLGFFSIYLRRCAGPPLGGPGEHHHHPAGGNGIGFASRSRRPRGLDRAVLESFPTMAYADVRAHRAGKGELECAVCLSEFDDDETLRLLLPRCAHAFHVDCIDAWLASHVTCPVCRAVLAPDHEAPTAAAPPLALAGVVPAAEQDAHAVPVPEQPEQAVVVAVDAEETEEERTRRDEAAELMRIASVKRVLHSKSSGGPCSTCAHTSPPSPRSGTRCSYPSTCSGRLRRATSGDRRSSKRAGDRSARCSFLSARAGMSVWHSGLAAPAGGRCWRAPSSQAR